MKELYEVKWSYATSSGHCHTDYKYFETQEEQRAFSEKKSHQPNVYKVVATIPHKLGKDN